MTVAMKKEQRWVIVGRIGLYTGQWQTRRDAIAEHVDALEGAGSERRRYLTTEQTRAWDRCKGRGDRAVKVTISYPR